MSWNPNGTSLLLAILVAIWTIPWKGMALWKAAQKKDLYWFIAILVLNTVGILEILYLYVFSKSSEKKRP